MSNSRPHTPGEIIRTIREAARITQDDLASAVQEETGSPIHKSAISKIEAGTRQLSFREAIAFSEILSIPLKELAAGYVQPNVLDLWTRSRDTFRSLDRRFNDSMTDLSNIQSWLTQLLQILEKAEGHPLPVGRNREAITAGVKEMLYFAETAGELANELSVISGTYGQLADLSSLPPETASQWHRDQHFEEQMKKLGLHFEEAGDQDNGTS